MFFLKTLLIISLALLSCKSLPQDKLEKIQIDEVRIYLDIKERGYTTAGATTYFDDLKRENMEYIILTKEEIDKVEEILTASDKKKHHQTKLGINLIFLEIMFFNKDNSFLSKVVISTSVDKASIIDLSRMTEYQVTNSSDLKWLQNLIDKVKLGVKDK